jgi:hypothetical protein
MAGFTQLSFQSVLHAADARNCAVSGKDLPLAEKNFRFSFSNAVSSLCHAFRQVLQCLLHLIHQHQALIARFQ